MSKTDIFRSTVLKILALVTCYVTCVVMTFHSGVIDSVHFKDDRPRLDHSKMLLNKYKICGYTKDVQLHRHNARFHASGYEILLGIATECFLELDIVERYMLRHSMTFALLPTGLLLMFFLFSSIGLSKSVTLLSIALLFSNIRFVGHSFFNVKDFVAAIVFFLCTIGFWVLARRVLLKNVSFPYLSYLALSVVAALPFLVRTPLLLHFGFLLLLVGYILCRSSGLSNKLVVCLMPVFSLSCIYLFYPVLWELGFFHGFIQSILAGSEYPHVRKVSAFGQEFMSNDLPWWYAFPWIPIQLTLLSSLFLVFLIPGLIASIKQLPKKFGSQKDFFSIESFWIYLWFVTIFSFLLVVILKPSLYESDRHIFFLYVPLAPLMAHGLSCVLHKFKYKNKVEYVLVCALFLVAVPTIFTQGRYAYTHENVLVNTFAPVLTKGYYKEYFELDIIHSLERAVKEHELTNPIFVREYFSPARFYLKRFIAETLERNRQREGYALEKGRPIIVHNPALCKKQPIVYIDSYWRLQQHLKILPCQHTEVERTKWGSTISILSPVL